MPGGRKQKIAVYGGTFDPPHRGHIALIKAAIKELDPYRLYIVPGYRTPGKNAPSAGFRDRAAMLRAALSGTGSRVRIHPFEFNRGRATYTWRTLEFFRGLHPEAELFFLMGSDCFGAFRSWKEPDRILRLARLVVGVRAGVPVTGAGGVPHIRLKGLFPEASSTALKYGLFAGGRPSGLAPGAWPVISKRGLYLRGLRRGLAEIMTADRFRHSAGTASVALELARKYGADPGKAALAALLHDAARDMKEPELRAMSVKPGFRMPHKRLALERAPVTAHPYAAALLAEKKFGIRDREILGAIRSHAFGARSPGLLDKIICVADLAESGRRFPEAAEAARLAATDLDAAYAYSLYVKLSHVFSGGGWIHPESAKIWKDLLIKLR